MDITFWRMVAACAGIASLAAFVLLAALCRPARDPVPTRRWRVRAALEWARWQQGARLAWLYLRLRLTHRQATALAVAFHDGASLIAPGGARVGYPQPDGSLALLVEPDARGFSPFIAGLLERAGFRPASGWGGPMHPETRVLYVRGAA